MIRMNDEKHYCQMNLIILTKIQYDGGKVYVHWFMQAIQSSRNWSKNSKLERDITSKIIFEPQKAGRRAEF